MSIEAVSAVLNMEVSDSTAKLVLIGLGDSARGGSEVFSGLPDKDCKV
jgi:hypothetical protein